MKGLQDAGELVSRLRSVAHEVRHDSRSVTLVLPFGVEIQIIPLPDSAIVDVLTPSGSFDSADWPDLDQMYLVIRDYASKLDHLDVPALLGEDIRPQKGSA